MNENKKLYKTLTDKNNGLSAAQEVHYATDFKVAKKVLNKILLIIKNQIIKKNNMKIISIKWITIL